MIKALLQKQLRELGAAFVRSSKSGKRRSRAGQIRYVVLFVGLLVLLMGSFASIAQPLASALVPLGLDALYFVLMELSALTVSVPASAFTSYAHLFRCKDDEQLLALPIPPELIFMVRCSGVYLTGLIYLLLVWVPAVGSYLRAAPRSGGALLGAVPVALALAGLSMLLAVLLGWAVALLTSRAKHKSIVTVVGTLVFLALYYGALVWVQGAVDVLAMDALQAGSTASRATAPLLWLGRAALGSVPALLLLLGLVVLCLLGFGKLLAGPYLRLLTRNTGVQRTEYREKPHKKRSPQGALLYRELQHLGACPAWLLNGALVSLLFPVAAVVVLWKAETLRAFAAGFPPESLPMLVCGFVCTMAAMNFLTASSVSLEGSTLWLLQSLPVTPWQVLRAKVELQVLLTFPGAVLCTVCGLIALDVPPVRWLPALAAMAAFVLLVAQLGLVFGLCLPNLHWTSEAVVVKQSGASLLAMLSGGLLAVGVLVLPLLWLEYVPAFTAQLVCLTSLVGGDILLYRWLRTKGAQRFAELN